MKNEIKEKFLPIGTVVMLKNGTKRIMITGFCTVIGKGEKQMWDYSGCLYPEGILSSEQTLAFNHDQIEKIYYLGLADDDEERSFKTKLNRMLELMNEKNEKNEENNSHNEEKQNQENNKNEGEKV